MLFRLGFLVAGLQFPICVWILLDQGWRQFRERPIVTVVQLLHRVKEEDRKINYGLATWAAENNTREDKEEVKTFKSSYDIIVDYSEYSTIQVRTDE